MFSSYCCSLIVPQRYKYAYPTIQFITLLSILMMVSFQRKRLRLKNFDKLKLVVENSTIHIVHLNAPHKRGIPNLEDNYPPLEFGPIERNQGAKLC